MTGLHTGHARTRGNQFPDLHLRPEDITVAELLKKAGYRTGLFGKWALGRHRNHRLPAAARASTSGSASSARPTRTTTTPSTCSTTRTRVHLARGNMGTQKDDYAHDLFTAARARFLEKQPADQPFFLYLCYTIPHANNEVGRDTGNGMEVPSDAPYINRNRGRSRRRTSPP